MDLTITPGDQLLAQFANQLGALSEREGHRALARAVNRTTTSVQSRTIRAIAKQSSIPTPIVRSQVRRIQVRPGSGEVLEGHVVATGNPIPLKEFRARQFSWGVRARVWAETRRFEGMFIFAGTFRSGQEVGSGHVFQRVTTASLPIQKQDGPAVPTEMVRNESAEQFERTVATMLPERVRHELGRLLP